MIDAECFMFTLYENRDKKVALLIKLGDCLGRSLRENVALFSIDGANETVIYITESDKVISGSYKINKDVSLNNIKIQDSSIFNDDTLYQKYINEKVSSFVDKIYNDDYKEADNSFGELLSLWENRLKFDSVQNKLAVKTQKFNESQKIINTPEFLRFLEIQPQVINFLQKNFDRVSKVPEIKNAINLSNTISEGFNIPFMTYQELEETQSYILNDGNSETIYEMICRQELVKKELLESKKEFDVIWATNPSIQKLASCIFESDEKIIDALSEAIKEVPYVALASKNNLFKVFSSSLSDIDGIGVSEKDIQKYASKIFEAKKEVKEFMINTLNEKFGVNVQNLQDPPSFKSLINTQVVIFETISRLSPNGSIIKKTLSELSEVLKQKSGVEAIDINNLIYEMFIRAGYGQILDENRMLSKYAQVDFRRIAKDLSDISTVINGMKDKLMSDQGQEDVGYESDENIEPEMPEEEMPEEEMPEEEMPEEEMPPEGMQQPEMEPEMPPEGMQQPEMEPEGMEQPEMEPEQIKSREQMMDDLNNLEQMIKDLADELNISDEKTSGPEEEEVD
jgi:hypothetical protein